MGQAALRTIQPFLAALLSVRVTLTDRIRNEGLARVTTVQPHWIGE